MRLNDERVKPAHELKVGDSVFLRKENLQWHVVVKALSERRGPAEQARQLYEETVESTRERERRSDLRRWGADPSAELKGPSYRSATAGGSSGCPARNIRRE